MRKTFAVLQGGAARARVLETPPARRAHELVEQGNSVVVIKHNLEVIKTTDWISVHKDLLAFQAKTEQRFEKVDGRLAKVDGRFDEVDGRLDRVEKGVRTLREDMPGIVGSAMREVLREQRRKSR